MCNPAKYPWSLVSHRPAAEVARAKAMTNDQMIAILGVYTMALATGLAAEVRSDRSQPETRNVEAAITRFAAVSADAYDHIDVFDTLGSGEIADVPPLPF